jgi:hypothetical protein
VVLDDLGVHAAGVKLFRFNPGGRDVVAPTSGQKQSRTACHGQDEHEGCNYLAGFA